MDWQIWLGIALIIIGGILNIIGFHGTIKISYHRNGKYDQENHR